MQLLNQSRGLEAKHSKHLRQRDLLPQHLPWSPWARDEAYGDYEHGPNNELPKTVVLVRGLNMTARKPARRATFVDDLLLGLERRFAELNARERHVVGSQYATALEMNKATLLEIEDVEQFEAAVEARGSALEERGLIFCWRELWAQKKGLALMMMMMMSGSKPAMSTQPATSPLTSIPPELALYILWILNNSDLR